MSALVAPPIRSLEELRHSPALPEAIRFLQSLWEEEQQARKQFYDDITDEVKAEFIEGEIIVHSPARLQHLETRDHIHFLLRSLVMHHQLGGKVLGEKACCHFPRNSYEPDVVYFGPEKTTLLKPETVIFPIPDLAIEILSDSTEKRDRGVKFEDYETHGVTEYWIIDAEKCVLEQYVRGEDNRYELQVKSGTGDLVSPVLGGLTISIRDLLQK
ncbi:Uma2 family endonuclease [Prosthecobacter fusiformis]|uniref:Uma2 family endonuclease n=1 Tax=Prosthecobacter fusiformis TaxID=48464 RepID=A0A4R7SRY4_9BACT|nr:Uma2 family endonuclease [Prosthecobacter fusiformis]TDU81226.1 Uma2 family endonuclease [Prosthecobacter fusiformis]